MVTSFVTIWKFLTARPCSAQSDTLIVCYFAPCHFSTNYQSSQSASTCPSYYHSLLSFYCNRRCGAGIVRLGSQLITREDCPLSSRSYTVFSSDSCVLTSSDAAVTGVWRSSYQKLLLLS